MSKDVVKITPVLHLDTNNGREEEYISENSIELELENIQKLLKNDAGHAYDFLEAVLHNQAYVDFLKTEYNRVSMPEYSYFRIKYISFKDTEIDFEEDYYDEFQDSAMKWMDHKMEAAYV